MKKKMDKVNLPSCINEKFLRVSTYLDNNLLFYMDGYWSRDYVVATFVTMNFLFPDRCKVVVISEYPGRSFEFSKLDDLSKLGKYLIYRDVITSEALSTKDDRRILRPVDGADGGWFFSKTENGKNYWNMINLECPRETLMAMALVSDQIKVNLSDYILGKVVSVSGKTYDWSSVVDICYL